MSVSMSRIRLAPDRDSRLTVKVKGVGMGDCLVDNGTRWKVPGSVLVRSVGSKEPHVMSLGADHEGEGRPVLIAADVSSGRLELSELVAVNSQPRTISRHSIVNDSLHDMGVLTLGNTVTEHDYFLG